MPKLRFSHHEAGVEKYRFFCPACACSHFVTFAPGLWTWNGDAERPTIDPSISAVAYHPPTTAEVAAIMSGEHVEPRPLNCHSFVVDGEIRYQTDCTHEFAGKSVPLGEADVP
jgi:hypothetical protein